MICARSGPTLTQVPVSSLKSSAMRPSNSETLLRVGRIEEADRVAAAVEAVLVERPAA